MRGLATGILLLIGLVAQAIGHEKPGEPIKLRPDGMSWQSWHMLEEHGLDQFDAGTFFKIHDVANKGSWDSNDILNIYGLLRESVVGDGSGMGDHHDLETITQESKAHVISSILKLVGKESDQKITAKEFDEFIAGGGELPDFGYGQGHHYDFEREYEEHHWLEHHKDNDPDVMNKHIEDIEHERLHHEQEIEATHDKDPAMRKISQGYRSQIILANLAMKYRANK